MDRLTRHELKSDKFVEEVGQTVHFLEAHRAQVIRYGAIAVAVLLVAGGTYFYMKQRAVERQQALYDAMQTYNARVLPGDPPAGMKAFKTAEARNEAIAKEMGVLMTKFSGSDEAAIATYLMGMNAVDQGKLADAERYLKKAVEDGGKDYASLAKLSLSEVYVAEGKTADAEKLLRELVASPTMLVTKENSTIALARVLAKSKPDEARKLLEPLRAQAGSASRFAIQTMAELGLAK
ncbi:MAG: tetratricopeptide repeat protein [Acidobacteria bacterium]|nr:tetratricopeptide repeat protein [Acidobacteriota bacterium]